MKTSKSVSLKTGGYTISWGIDGADDANSQIIPDQEDDENESHNDQFLKLKKINNEVVYQDAFPDTDIQYYISSGSVKENIILKSMNAKKSFTETYQIGNLVAKQTDSKTIQLFESGDSNFRNPVYTINAPQMADAGGAVSDQLSITLLQQSGGTAKISIQADESWLNSSDRVYPITIDPQVTTPRTSSAIRDTFVSGAPAYQNQAGISNTMGTLYIGNETANYGKCRILLNFTLPQLNKGDMVVSANLNLAQTPNGLNPSTGSMQINAYPMGSAWDEKTVTWNNSFNAVKSATDGLVSDYFMASQSTANYYNYWDITKLVKGWYSGSVANNGIVLKAQDEDTAVRNVYYASNYTGGENAFPYLSIYYVNNAGLEDYWSYHSQSAGRAGTGSVNDYTGNLVWSVPIMGTTGARAPLDFSLIYNGYQTGTHYQDNQRGSIFGWGWQSNLSQRVDPIDENSGTNDIEKAKYKLLAAAGYKYVYQDGDGTEHYFITDPKNSSRIIDEDGLGLEVTVDNGSSDEHYILKYKDGSKETFTTSGYLRKVYDSENNALTLSYNGAVLTSIQDGAGRTTSIFYSEYGSMNKIIGPDGKVTTFGYYGGNLMAINYPDSKSVNFTYNSSNQMEKAIDVDGTYVQYGYTTGVNNMVLNRVKDASEYTASGTVGNKISFTYKDDNSTTFAYIKSGQAEASAQKETFNFDDAGRTTSVVHPDGTAGTYSYTDNLPKDAASNKMTSQAYTSASVTNLLQDHNAELNNGSWAGSNWSSPGGTFNVDSTTAYLGTKSLKVVQNQPSPARSGAVQKLTNLAVGTVYTLSAYAKTNNVTSGSGANLYVAFFNGSTSLGTVNGTGLTGTKDWQRLSVTFTVPANTTRVEVYGGLSYANGTAWFDCFQLETGSIMNLYNLLENSEFRDSTNYLPDRWSVTNFTSGDGMSDGWLRIGGNVALNKNIYQKVYINKPANSIAFMASAKADGHSVPTNRDGRYYAVDFGMYFTDGSSQWDVINFNSDANGAQFTSGPIAAKKENESKTISRVEYYIIYYKNVNDAKFKFLQLNMDDTGTTYAYNTSTGLLDTSKQNAKNRQKYDYSNANELTGSTTSNDAASFSQSYTYKYASDFSSLGNPHRLIAARSSQTGVGLTFGYGDNNHGNVIDTKMGTIDSDGRLDPDSPYIETAQEYDQNDNYVKTSTDQRGNTTSYDVDPTTGLTNSVTDPLYNETKYYYNPDNNLLTAVRAQSSAGTVENTYGYDAADQLNKITHNGFDYAFTRDGFGNTINIAVGNQNLITNAFAAGNGNLQTSTYGNGFRLGYSYDPYDRVTAINKNDAAAYQYLYDARGNLAKLTDKTGGTDLTSTYSYDLGDRLIQKSASDGSAIQYSYDNMDRNILTGYTFSGQMESAYYGYGDDNRKDLAILASDGRITYEYDSLNREVKTDINPVANQDPTLRAQRSYVNVSGNRTTTMVDTYNNFKHVGTSDTVLSKYIYTYDKNGNISTVTDKNGKVTTYTYDELNQLIRADDQKSGISTTYSYDVGGNITTASTYAYVAAPNALGASTGTVSYAYGNSGWKDLLTSYNGNAITYDAIGNPLTYRKNADGDTMEFTWDGRQLKTAVAKKDNGDYTYNASFTYNENGIRTGKTVNGTTTKYLVDGSTVIAQQTGSNVLWFMYESDGNRVGFTYNGTAYYYTKNAQGDVTGIVDGSCNTVVEYTYDAWGKLLSTTGSLAGTIGKVNPFLYRGYYYDSETGLYYLNSRYYDPQTGRFISEDAQLNPDTGMVGNNLFAYCNNNPVTMVDYDGSRMLVEPGIETPDEQVMAAKYTTHGSTAVASLSPWGKPNTHVDDYSDGYHKERWYGEDGRAVKDRHHTDHNNPKHHPDPHDQDWDWSDPKHPKLGKAYPSPMEMSINWKPVLGMGIVLVASAGMLAIAVDDITGIGAADDAAEIPIFAVLTKGLQMVGG
jgi:RHS repeat-associated core domain